ncbi:hypothetical protein NKI50_12670 [Mesorhizobium sp. M0563]|uniref:hypothetical protein n=1 Tax=Mesorhizobium sp. M0563 TaxID=2956959 RepID=UPI003336D4D3
MANTEKPTAEMKKQDAAAKSNFDLHVLLIIRQDECNKARATLTAYREGVQGITRRLAPPAPVTK